MLLPSDIVAEARTWLDTDYHHQARVKGVGVDCIGLIIGVGRELGLFDLAFDYNGYGPEPFNNLLRSVVEKHMTQSMEPKAGTVALIRWAVEPQHCGIITDDGTIIHAYERVGHCVEHRYNDVWKARTVAWYEFPGVTYD